MGTPHTATKRIMSIACNMKTKPPTVSRKAWRRARALEQARSHETSIANKGKPSKRARVAEAMENERKEVQKQTQKPEVGRRPAPTATAVRLLHRKHTSIRVQHSELVPF